MFLLLLFDFFKSTERFQDVKNEEEYKQIIGYEVAITSIFIISALSLLLMSIFLFKKFGWNIYRNVGADIKKTVVLKRRYNFGLILKFKIFFIFGIIAQCFIFREKSEDFVFDFANDLLGSFDAVVKVYAAPVLIVIFIINVICGYLSVKKENNFLMILHIITDMIFIIFSVYMVYSINADNSYYAVKKSLTGFAIIEMILLFISIYLSMVVMADFKTVDLNEDNKNQIGRRLSL